MMHINICIPVYILYRFSLLMILAILVYWLCCSFWEIVTTLRNYERRVANCKSDACYNNRGTRGTFLLENASEYIICRCSSTQISS